MKWNEALDSGCAKEGKNICNATSDPVLEAGGKSGLEVGLKKLQRNLPGKSH